MIEAFDVHDVNPNPARFDPKKCEAINAEQVRALGEADFRDRLVPYLADAYPDPSGETAQVSLVSADSFDGLTVREQEILSAAAPLIQTRIQLLRESRDMLGFLFVPDASSSSMTRPWPSSRPRPVTCWMRASVLWKGSAPSSGGRTVWRMSSKRPSSRGRACRR